MSATPRYCCLSGATLCYWAVWFAFLAGAFAVAIYLLPALVPYATVSLLVAAGLACLITFVRRRAFHCQITGPAFLLAAAVLALGPAGVWQVPTTGLWLLLGLVIGLALLLEQRYVRRLHGS